MDKKVSVALIVLVSLILFSFGLVIKTNNEDIKTTETNELTEIDTSKDSEDLYDPIVVLELYTSQGCSSCPPADVLLDKVKNEYAKEVYALSYHVDYWNYIGWRDPFSKSKFTEKQRQYNIKFKNRSNYTPQLVINGDDHFVGSNSAKVYRGIAKYAEEKTSNHIDLKNVNRRSNLVSFDYEVQGNLNQKDLRVVLVLDERITEVKRGENRNRTLKNSNIVVAERTIDLKGQNGTGTITIPEIVENGDEIHLLVLVENNTFDILAADKQSIK